MSLQLHALAALTLGRVCDSHGVRSWVSPRVGLVRKLCAGSATVVFQPVASQFCVITIPIARKCVISN
jgi:hypothetical protein